MRFGSFRPILNPFDVVGPRLVGAVETAERVAQVDVGHRPFGREVHRDAALEKRVSRWPRAPHMTE